MLCKWPMVSYSIGSTSIISSHWRTNLYKTKTYHDWNLRPFWLSPSAPFVGKPTVLLEAVFWPNLVGISCGTGQLWQSIWNRASSVVNEIKDAPKADGVDSVSSTLQLPELGVAGASQRRALIKHTFPSEDGMYPALHLVQVESDAVVETSPASQLVIGVQGVQEICPAPLNVPEAQGSQVVALVEPLKDCHRPLLVLISSTMLTRLSS